MTRPKQAVLSGIKVLDMSRILAGPWCAMTLGDLGADVIKVENPDGGDDTRHLGTAIQGGERTYYLCVNRNKRSIAIDFRTPEGQQIIRGLAAQSDVLIENYKLGDLARYGLDYETLRAGLRLPGARLRRNVTDMPELMRWADLAVTAGGSTCWEAACLGLPLCSLVIAENQLASARRLARAGTAEVMEPGPAGWEPDKLAGVLDALAHNSARRAQMTTAGRALVDGRGAERVTNILTGREPTL